MKKVIGYSMFWVALGMVIGMLIPNVFVEILCVIVLILVGFQLYQCR